MTQLALIQNDDTPQVEATQYAPKEVAFVKPFEQQLALIEGEFSKFVFDYSKKEDNDAARSLIRKLQKSRAAIEKVAKAERDPAILYQRHVIDEEKKLTVRVQALIDQYEKPLKEWEAEDQKRKDRIQGYIAAFRPSPETVLMASAEYLKGCYADIEAIDPDVGFDEFAADAFAARITTLEYLKEHIAIAEKREADAARLAQLEAEAEARRLADEAAEAERLQKIADAERAEWEAKEKAEAEAAAKAAKEAEDARIAKAAQEAAEKARKDAEERAAKDAAEAAAREQELKNRLAAQEAARLAAEKKAAEDAAAAKAAAEKQAADAVAAEQKRAADEQAAKDAEEARKAADRAHRGKIHSEIATAIVDILCDVEKDDDPAATAKAIVIAICGDAIPHLKIIY